MARPTRSSTVLACALSACALAAAAPAAGAAKHHGKAASTQGGVVLSAAHGSVRLVDSHHVVSDARVRSPRHLRRGTIVAIDHGTARVTGHARTVSFYARVVHSSAHGAVLRLGDGSTFKLASVRGGHGHGHGARSASTLTVTIEGLAPGQAVLITISSDGQGNVALTIKLVSGATSIGDGEQQASGVVTDDSSERSFAIRTAAGSGLRFADPQRLLAAAQASQCDIVDVTYHAQHRKLVADTLRVTGQSDQGVCAGQQGDGNEVDGVVTAIADDLSSITVDPGDGSDAATIPVPDPTLLDGVQVGDQVAVTTDDAGNATEIDVLDDSSATGPGDDPGPQPGDDSGDE